MLTNKILGTLATATLVTTSLVFAQGTPAGGPGMPPPEGGAQASGEVNATVDTNTMPPGPRPGGLFQRIFGNKEQRQEIRQEYRDDMQNAVGELKQGMMERREYMMGSSTPGSASPTPWKDFRKDMKDMRQDMRAMMPRMASITDAQVAALSVKLGVTVDSIRAQLASGTPLREIVKDKLTKEELDAIIPRPMMASGSMATGSMMRDERREVRQGFFNSLRERFFGGGDASAQVNANAGVNADGTSADANVNVNADAQLPAPQAIRNFFRRLFGF